MFGHKRPQPKPKPALEYPDLASFIANQEFVDGWKLSRAKILESIKQNHDHQLVQMEEMRNRGEAVKDAFAAFRYWTMKLESDNPEPVAVAGEMRELMKKLEGILYG